jgi:hypothetical protein
MADVDIQTLYRKLQNNVSKLAAKLKEYISDHKSELNQNNNELIRIAKLYMVLQYFADTNISQIDGNITENNVDRYKQELYDTGIKNEKLNAIQSADLLDYFPSRKVLIEFMKQFEELKKHYDQEYTGNLVLIEAMKQENHILKNKVQDSQHQALAVQARLAPALSKNVYQQYCNIKEYIRQGQNYSDIYNVNTGKLIHSVAGKADITIKGNNKYYIYEYNNIWYEFQIIDIFLVYIDEYHNIKTLNSYIYNQNIRYKDTLDIYAVYQTDTGIPINMKYVPYNNNINGINVIGFFRDITNQKDIFSKTGKKMYVIEKPAQIYPPANYLPNQQQQPGLPV